MTAPTHQPRTCSISATVTNLRRGRPCARPVCVCVSVCVCVCVLVSTCTSSRRSHPQQADDHRHGTSRVPPPAPPQASPPGSTPPTARNFRLIYLPPVLRTHNPRAPTCKQGRQRFPASPLRAQGLALPVRHERHRSLLRVRDVGADDTCVQGACCVLCVGCVYVYARARQASRRRWFGKRARPRRVWLLGFRVQGSGFRV